MRATNAVETLCLALACVAAACDRSTYSSSVNPRRVHAETSSTRGGTANAPPTCSECVEANATRGGEIAPPVAPADGRRGAADSGIAAALVPQELQVNGMVIDEPLSSLANGGVADFLRVDRLSAGVLSRARMVARRVENLTSSDVLAALLVRVSPIVQRDCRPLSNQPTDDLRTFAVVIDPNGAVLSAAPAGPGGTPREPVTLYENDFTRCVERAMTNAQLGPIPYRMPILEIVPPVNSPLICWWATPSCTTTVDALLLAVARDR